MCVCAYVYVCVCVCMWVCMQQARIYCLSTKLVYFLMKVEGRRRMEKQLKARGTWREAVEERQEAVEEGREAEESKRKWHK